MILQGPVLGGVPPLLVISILLMQKHHFFTFFSRSSAFLRNSSLSHCLRAVLSTPAGFFPGTNAISKRAAQVSKCLSPVLVVPGAAVVK
jgi:hypothetical protein